ncbi:MAG TPA: DEAD/DEAH box helicase [Acidimicrobiales bacterium]|nr:DEAD/DEAH box helicase [Acidimicrobiales bacterium]
MPSSAPSFAVLGVPSDIVAALDANGIASPFPIQAMTLPDALEGRDVCGKAPTGSGKTIAFGIGAVARLNGKGSRPKHPRVLVLTPTRELAAQVASELQVLADPRGLKVDCFYGGVGYGPQLKALSRGVDIAVACPGRLGDLLERGSIRLDAVEIVVIDEADRMADMGFLPDVRRILDLTPAGRQTLLFSATLDGDVDVLVRRYQHEPARHELEVDEDDASAATHLFWRVSSGDRVERTAEVVTAAGPTIVFSRTKHGADRIARQLEQRGIRAAAIHGDRSQKQREKALDSFVRGAVDALVATDVAARGIHVDGVNAVVHFDPSADPKDYVHRSGRTARAGATGVVVSFVTPDKTGAVKKLQRELGVPVGTTEADLQAIEKVLGPPPPRRVLKEREPDRSREPSPNANRGGVRASRPYKTRKPGGRSGSRNDGGPRSGSRNDGGLRNDGGPRDGSGKPAGFTKPGKPGKPGKPSGFTKPTKPGAPGKPSRPGKPGKPGRHGTSAFPATRGSSNGGTVGARRGGSAGSRPTNQSAGRAQRGR